MKSNKNLVVGGLSLLIVLLAVVIFSLGSDLFLRPVPGEEQVGTPIRTPVITISVNPASIQHGGSSTLSWYVQYATSCTATGGWSGVQPVQGKRAVSPSITTTYTLTCTNGHRTAQRGVTLNVNSPSYTITASAGTGGSIQPTGQIIIQPGTSQLFTITPQSGFQVSGLTVDGQSVAAAPSYTFSNVNANHSIIANFAPAQPSIDYGMDPVVPIDPGASVSLAWTAHNAVSCVASGGWSGSRALSGSMTLSPWVTTTYTLTCSNSVGTQAVATMTAIVNGSTQCSDGIDNDSDGFIDMNDPGCTSLGDNDEFNSGGSSVTHGRDLTLAMVGPAAIGITSFTTAPGGDIYSSTPTPSYAQYIPGTATYDGYTVNGPHLLIQGVQFTSELDIYSGLPIVFRGDKFRFGHGNLRPDGNPSNNAIGVRQNAPPIYILYSEIGAATSAGAPAVGSPGQLQYAVLTYQGTNGVVIARNNILMTSDSISTFSSNTQIVENLLHDFTYYGDCTPYNGSDHTNGIMVDGYGNNVSILRNKILFDQRSACTVPEGTSIAIFRESWGGPSNVTIDSNYLTGAGYSAEVDLDLANPPTMVTFTNNVFGLDFYSNAGYWGPVSHWGTGGLGSIWSGNAFSNGVPINH